MNNNNEPNTESGKFAAGQMLAQQREKLGLDIEECSDKLKISSGKILALESGNDAPFASEIFIRGYLRNYAKLLNLSIADVLDCYDSQPCANETSDAVRFEKKSPSGSKWWLPYIIGIVVVIGWFLVSNYLESQANRASEVTELSIVPPAEEGAWDQQPSVSLEDEASDKTEQVIEPSIETPLNDQEKESLEIIKDNSLEDTVNDSASNVIDNSKAITDVESAESSPLENVVANGESSSSSVVVEPGSAISPLPLNINSDVEDFISHDVLYFTFLEECWVEVVDATNEVIASSLRQGNTQFTVKGRAPFSIVLGNVKGTTLRFNDDNIPLNSVNGSRTLRLTVGG